MMNVGQRFLQKHVLGLEDFSREEIEIILQVADSFKEISDRQIKKVPTLRGRTVINLFLRTVNPDPAFVRDCRQANERRHF